MMKRPVDHLWVREGKNGWGEKVTGNKQKKDLRGQNIGWVCYPHVP